MSQPVDKFHEGTVSVSIFQNESPKGAFKAATVQLRYKDKEGEWKNGSSYSAIDLEHLALAALEARKRIRALDRPKSDTPEAG